MARDSSVVETLKVPGGTEGAARLDMAEFHAEAEIAAVKEQVEELQAGTLRLAIAVLGSAGIFLAH